MALRIFHTADIHLGLPFTSRDYPPDLRDDLVKARLNSLERMVTIANEQKCELFVIAGDLFDNLRVKQQTITDAAKVIKQFSGVALVLPGNHDFIQSTDDPFWKKFAEVLGESHLVICESSEIDLRNYDIPAVIYPGVCNAKHSEQNAIDWIAGNITSDEVIKIGIAHGSLKGLSPDFNKNYFPMTEEQLKQSGVDLWLLGHTHIRYPQPESGEKASIFYSGIPEPDGFDCNCAGFAWIIDLTTTGETRFHSHEIGRFRFHTIEEEVQSKSDLTRIDKQIKAFNKETDLLKVKLTGRLAREDFKRLRELDTEWPAHVCYYERNITGVLREIGLDEINERFSEQSFPHKLLTTLEKRNETLAVQLAWKLLEEASE